MVSLVHGSPRPVGVNKTISRLLPLEKVANRAAFREDLTEEDKKRLPHSTEIFEEQSLSGEAGA